MAETRREYQCDPHLVPNLRGFVRDECRQHWNEPSDAVAIAALELAVSEVASNIILHGYRGTSGQPIELTLSVDGARACVIFRYQGCSFDPQLVKPPRFNGNAESGFGMYLIQQSVDDVQFTRDDTGRCEIRLVKNRT